MPLLTFIASAAIMSSLQYVPDDDWVGVYHRCPSLAAARRVLALVERARPDSARAAEPLLKRGLAAEKCRPLVRAPEDYEWIDFPAGIEFDGDGYGVDLIRAKDSKGRPLTMVYQRGAC